MVRIEVQGQIGARWRAWFEDLAIDTQTSPDGTTITVLTGPVVDEAALQGLLQKLYTLGLPLLQVQRREDSVAGRPRS